MLIPYIVFHGQCADAVTFYENVFEAKSENAYPYGDYVPEGTTPPEGLRDWIMHAELDICGSRFWFADEAESVTTGNNVRLSLSVETKREAEQIFTRLSEGGHITLPPTETFYCNFHGAVTDRFGLCWNIVSQEPPEGA